MPLVCLTANHRNAPFELLEKLSFGAADAARVLVESHQHISGAVVLATCNRFEAYLEFEGDADAAVTSTIAAMSVASGVGAAHLSGAVSVLTDERVVSHLFAVSSGLESVVVGEDEISGQVSRALERARASGTTSSGLERLFQSATEASRGVKSRTAIGGAGRSLVRLALDLASTRVADWVEVRVLIVGTGHYAGAAVAALRERGAVPRVHSPSGRAAGFATRYGLTVESDLARAIANSDVVITCTTTLVITELPDESRRLIIDLGLPRNVEPAIRALPGVELLDLETIGAHAPLEELSATSEARVLVGDAASRFAADRSVEPSIVALRKHIFALLEAEIERARARGDNSQETEAALRHLAGVLLHAPSVRGRELARDGRVEEFAAGLEALYGIESDISEQGVQSETA